MADRTSQNVTTARPDIPSWYRVAASVFVTNVGVTHAEIARRVGRSRETVARAWNTPAMRRAVNEAMQGRRADEITVAAQRALLRGFAEGKYLPTALKVLQARGIMPSDRLEVTGADGEPLIPADITAEIRAYAAKLGGTVNLPAAPAPTPPEVAEIETEDGRGTEPGA